MTFTLRDLLFVPFAVAGLAVILGGGPLYCAGLFPPLHSVSWNWPRPSAHETTTKHALLLARFVVVFGFVQTNLTPLLPIHDSGLCEPGPCRAHWQSRH